MHTVRLIENNQIDDHPSPSPPQKKIEQLISIDIEGLEFICAVIKIFTVD